MIAAGIFLCSPWASSARAEIFDGPGFEAINWNMHIADAERGARKPSREGSERPHRL